MNLKIFKILTVILFLLITFDTGHIGGQFGYFIILGLISGGLMTIASIILLVVLIVFLRSSFKPSNKDFYVFLIGGIVLLIPIISHINFLVTKSQNGMDVVFSLTTFSFLIVYVLTLFSIKK